MDGNEFEEWFEANERLLETAYLAGEHPWQQSGFGLHSNRTAEQWEAQRRPIADCLDRSGTFLDIGCASGYLIESVQRWCAAKAVSIEPYGLDIAPELAELARRRLPQWVDRIGKCRQTSLVPPREHTAGEQPSVWCLGDVVTTGIPSAMASISAFGIPSMSPSGATTLG